MKLTLAACRTTRRRSSCVSASRSTSRPAAAAGGASRRRGGGALDLQPHRALSRARITSRSSRVGTLAELAGDRGADLSAALYRLRDEAAALHLFRVAAGLDSLVPGEGEILGQVRTAFEAGSPGPLLDQLFRQALHAGQARPARDRDQREPRVGALGGSRARAAGLRRSLRTARARARRREDERGDRAEPRSRAARTSPSSPTGRSRTARSSPRRFGAEAIALDGDRSGARARRRRRLVDERLRPRARRARSSARRSERARGGRCCWSTSPSRATSILRSTSSTAASSTTSTISRPSSPRRSRVGGPRRRGRSGSSPRRPSASATGRPRSTSCPTIASLRALAEEIRDSELATRRRRGSPRASAGTSSR